MVEIKELVKIYKIIIKKEKQKLRSQVLNNEDNFY